MRRIGIQLFALIMCYASATDTSAEDVSTLQKQAADQARLHQHGQSEAYQAYLEARTLYKGEETLKAFASIDKAIRLSPGTAVYHYWKAYMYLEQQGNLQTALQEINTACALEPHGTGCALKAQILCSMKRMPEAIAAANQAIEKLPNVAMGYTTKASILVAEGKPQEAENCLTAALHCQDVRPSLLMRRARLALQLKHWNIVLSATEPVVHTKDAAAKEGLRMLIEARMLRAQAFEGMKKLDLAKKEYAEAIATWPDSRQVHQDAYNFFKRIGDNRDAQVEATSLQKVDEDFVPFK